DALEAAQGGGPVALPQIVEQALVERQRHAALGGADGGERLDLGRLRERRGEAEDQGPERAEQASEGADRGPGEAAEGGAREVRHGLGGRWRRGGTEKRGT